MQDAELVRKAVVVEPEQGRVYAMGRMRAVFKIDSNESAERISVSEWWLEPRTRGPGPHAHSADHVFRVLTGILSVHAHENWSEVAAGGYVFIPAGTPHDFENRGSTRAGFISFNAPGGFETRMADIASALAAEDLCL